MAGDFLGDCEPAHHRHEPIYRNTTVREALNLMAIRSLQVASGQLPTIALPGAKRNPSRGSTASAVILRQTPAGLGGVPIIQTF